MAQDRRISELVQLNTADAGDLLAIVDISAMQTKRIEVSGLTASIDHNLLLNYVGNQHIDHSTVNIIAGTGLQGGGNITASRTLDIADTGVTAGTYGTINSVGSFTVNPQGQLTNAQNILIEPLNIGAQPLDADLTAISALNATGLLARTAIDTWVLRSLVSNSLSLVITNPLGVSGNPTFTLAQSLESLGQLAGVGLLARRTDGTIINRTIQDSAYVTVANGNGDAGDPVILFDPEYEFDWGSGADGDVTVNTPITLTRDMFYSSLTIGAGGTINTAGYKIWVDGALNGTGIIQNNGNTGGNGGTGGGGAGAAGTPAGSNSLGGGTAGGVGGGPNAQGPANTASQGMGGNGGQGGAGGNGGPAGGAGVATNLRPLRAKTTHFLFGNALIQGGTGGRGGSGGAPALFQAAGGGGGGGGGAGVIRIFTKLCNFTGTIRAIGGNGGNGGNGTGAAGGGGGGAGGGGGTIQLFTLLLQENPTFNVNGGTGGAAGNNGATVGLAGGVGRVLIWEGASDTYVRDDI